MQHVWDFKGCRPTIAALEALESDPNLHRQEARNAAMHVTSRIVAMTMKCENLSVMASSVSRLVFLRFLYYLH